MAARRILSLIAAKYPQNPLSRELSRSFHPSPNSFSRNYEQYTRGFQSLSEVSIPSVQNPTEKGSCSSNSDHSTSECIPSSENDQAAVKHQVNSNLKVSERHDLAMVFTCNVCNTRQLKTASRESYDKGVVVARCNGCDNLHLIADRLGWFGEPSSVEEFLAARGEEVKKGSPETLNLTLEDLAGRKNLGI
ncbi:hypothetical protein C2S53_020430 [Perilla frutescens var. hirtella]|uniref:DNL-type domain-containing protein n=1 Tax=Perilla frutescens var. hirtella TaxID=608512 RepID=A0AAD4IT45_PERFH|nr:hypothetical protein C2S53_020430 [Perilla frutescens var. hirtella]